MRGSVTPPCDHRRMEILLGICVVALVLTGAVLVTVLARGRVRAEALDEAVRRAVDEARRSAADERDAAVRVALEHTARHNDEVIGRERERVGEELDTKKALIDAQLGSMNAKLDQVSSLMQTLDANHGRSIGELSEALSLQHAGVTSLVQTTQSLREALSSTKARGQWGERMAEDVLALAGFVENVNYRKQKVLEGARGVPDFTFLLPNDLLLHMDVKFPLDNYLRCCDATSDLERKRYRDDFLKDVRARVTELSGRDYIDAGGSTVDFVLCFIPNEQLYGFIHEQGADIIDDAVRRRVVFCSPLSLFAVLALIRQMVENLQLARTSDEILSLLGQFADQWQKFVGQMEKVGTRIESVGREYAALVGTRRRALEKPLNRIDDLRAGAANLELVEDDPPRFALEA